jgi:hypothetical protein
MIDPTSPEPYLDEPESSHGYLGGLTNTNQGESFALRRFRLPELNLMLAVLDDAIHCFLKYENIPTRRARRLFSDVEDWFFSQKSNSIFDFENVCEGVGIDPDYVRSLLLRSTRRSGEGSYSPEARTRPEYYWASSRCQAHGSRKAVG